MCLKNVWEYLKKIWNEVWKVENVGKYIIYGLLALLLSAVFQYWITPHPKIEVTVDPNAGDAYRIRIKNIGNKATENLQFRLLYKGSCILGIDEAELNYLNKTKEDYIGEYSCPPYSKKWLVNNIELNPGVEVSFVCSPKYTLAFQIRISGSNFREIIKSYP